MKTLPAMKSAILTLAALLLTTSIPAADKPNILWFVVDDMSAHFSCLA